MMTATIVFLVVARLGLGLMVRYGPEDKKLAAQEWIGHIDKYVADVRAGNANDESRLRRKRWS